MTTRDTHLASHAGLSIAGGVATALTAAICRSARGQRKVIYMSDVRRASAAKTEYIRAERDYYEARLQYAGIQAAERQLEIERLRADLALERLARLPARQR